MMVDLDPNGTLREASPTMVLTPELVSVKSSSKLGETNDLRR
jgi:hypothetical protein